MAGGLAANLDDSSFGLLRAWDLGSHLRLVERAFVRGSEDRLFLDPENTSASEGL